MNTKPRVFVVHENLDMNFSDAERFGEIVFVTNKEWNPRRGSITNSETLAAIRRKLIGEFAPDRDFLILNGPPVLLGYAFHVVASITINNRKPGIRMLSWDKPTRRYIEGIVEDIQ